MVGRGEDDFVPKRQIVVRGYVIDRFGRFPREIVDRSGDPSLQSGCIAVSPGRETRASAIGIASDDAAEVVVEHRHPSSLLSALGKIDLPPPVQGSP